jgi:hypothetical protein
MAHLAIWGERSRGAVERRDPGNWVKSQKARGGDNGADSLPVSGEGKVKGGWDRCGDRGLGCAAG